jgi:hypothetical protein
MGLVDRKVKHVVALIQEAKALDGW